MAKVIAPLMSFGARGKLADSLVYFPWKGIPAVRSYVIPANPDTQPQKDQRGYLRDAVALVHAAQLEADPFNPADKAAYEALGTLQPTPRTWFNEFCKQYIDQHVKALKGAIWLNGVLTPGVDTLTLVVDFLESEAETITAATVRWGTNKSSLIYTDDAVVVGTQVTGVATPITTGEKYWVQIVPTAHANYVGCRSGLYAGYPN